MKKALFPALVLSALLGGCATVLVHLLKKKKNGEGDRP